MRLRTLSLALPFLIALGARAEEPPERGSVVISVERFEELLEAAREKPDPDPDPEPPPPLGVSLEDLRLSLTVNGDHASVRAQLVARVLSDEWVKVPLLSSDTAIASLRVDGKETALGEEEGRYVMHLKGAGRHPIDIQYKGTVETLVGGHRLQLSVPRVATAELEATLPGTGWEVHVLPSSGLELTPGNDGRTRVAAALVRTDRLQVLWGSRGPGGHVFTRAAYALEVVGEGVFAVADYEIEIDSDVPRDVPVISADYALRDVTVDGESGRVVLVGQQHAVTLQGHGTRRIRAEFALNVDRSGGQPAVDLDVPVVPISKFDLVVPGKRDVSVDPLVPLVVEADESATRVTAHFPKVSRVRFGWTDSRPVPVQNVRMNAEGFHAVAAEQGGLRINARFKFNVISGKASEIRFRMPREVVIYEVTGDGVADWRTIAGGEGGTAEGETTRQLAVYLDEPLHGRYELEVAYDSLLRKNDPVRTTGVRIPVIEPAPVHRNQGVLLLLAGEELEFDPIETDGLSAIGEEALPQDVRSALSAKVAHGFKYVGDAPVLTVRLQEPLREAAKFDVLMNTLLTLDEGALRGQASADVTIKSGRFKELVFRLDPAMTVLDVVAPALLKFAEIETPSERVVTATFTEEMEGTIRVGLSFERILDPSLERLDLAPITVAGADVQRGHVALESAAAVEVEGLPGDSIHAIGVDELPRALTAATSNPILQAYKYSHLPYDLAIAVTQHEALSPVDSRIQAAHVATVLKQQGNMVTSVRYIVTNQSKQFLRVELPEHAEPWQVLVDGRTVRPARDGDRRLLIPLPRSESTFEVALDYASRRSPLGFAGSIKLSAPRPDLFVGRLDWSLDLPEEFDYHRVKSNLTVDEDAPLVKAVELRRELIAPEDDAPWVSVGYVKELGGRGRDIALGVIGAIFALLLLRMGRGPSAVERGLTLGLGAGAVAGAAFLHASPWAILLPVLVVLTIGYSMAARRGPEPEGA